MNPVRINTVGGKFLRWGLLSLGAILALEAARLGTSWIHGKSVDNTSPTLPASETEVRVVCLGHVDLRHGITPLWPMASGRVTKVEVCENEKVACGAVLLRLDDSVAQLRVQEAAADLSASEDQLAQARVFRAQYLLKLTQQDAAIKALGWRLEAARQILQRKRALVQANQLSREEAGAAAAAMHELEAALTAEECKLQELKLQDTNLAPHRAQAEVDAKKARLAQARKAVDECCLRAPEAGVLLRVQVRAGMILSPQQPQAPILFCPDDTRVIRAEVEQEFAGLITVGQEARIQDDNSGTATWRGRVRSIAGWYSHRRSMIQEPFQFNDVRTLECLIAVDPNQPPLRIGQRVRVLLNSTRP